MDTPTVQPDEPVRRPKRLPLAVAIIAIVALAGVAGAFVIARTGLLGDDDEASFGAASAKAPDPASLIETERWGEVPPNQICVVLEDGGRRKTADKAAAAVGGTVVGEVEFVGVYQIEFPGKTEDDLSAALEKAQAVDGVALAFPNQQVYLDGEIWGVRVDPYADPVYDGPAGAGYRAIGVSKAWSYVRGAGIELSPVKVGVVDDGLYMPGEGAENEFEGGKTKIEFPDPAAGENAAPQVKANGKVNPAGSHGTGVSTVIGADPDNGGPAGVAGPLGDKLTISMINSFAGQYGTVQTTPDPDDPTKAVLSDGKAYTLGSLVALAKQVEAGAKVINCSWGNSKTTTQTVAAYKRFFEKMNEQHPDVIFVCSGGNGGTVMDGSTRIPSGLKLPNMVTVGALDPDGKTAEYADVASDNYEITLGAPGTGAVVGLDAKGGPVQQDGSSFAAPQVAAAAAILKSLNPKLTAGEIKQILVETARPGVPTESDDPNAQSTLVNKEEMGAGILAVDEAVLKVINDMRSAKGLAPLTPEMLEKMGVVDAVAITGKPGEYTVKGIVEAASEKGVTLKIEVVAEQSSIGGKTEQQVSAPGEAQWSVTLPKDEGTIKVTRLDNGAASVITIEHIDINGTWTGTYTITDLTITDQEAAKEEGCALALTQQIVGKPLPMTLVFTVDESGYGTAVMTVDTSSLGEMSGDDEPQTLDVQYAGNTVMMTTADGKTTLPATVSRSGSMLYLKGSLSGKGKGYTWAFAISASKPDTKQ